MSWNIGDPVTWHMGKEDAQGWVLSPVDQLSHIASYYYVGRSEKPDAMIRDEFLKPGTLEPRPDIVILLDKKPADASESPLMRQMRKSFEASKRKHYRPVVRLNRDWQEVGRYESIKACADAMLSQTSMKFTGTITAIFKRMNHLISAKSEFNNFNHTTFRYADEYDAAKTPEDIARMRASGPDDAYSAPNKEVVMISADGKELYRCASGREMAEYSGVSKGTVSSKCRHNIKNEFAGCDFTFRFAEEWDKGGHKL